MLWIFVALEVDVAIICASAPVLKPLFRRYFNNSINRSFSNAPRAIGSKNTRRNDLETAASFHDVFQEQVELGSVDRKMISGETQKPLPAIPTNGNGLVIRKDDRTSEESVFIIQQMEIEVGEPTRLAGGQEKKGKRSKRFSDITASKEPWSGV